METKKKVRLSEEAKTELYNLYKDGANKKELAETYGVCYNTVVNIINRIESKKEEVIADYLEEELDDSDEEEVVDDLFSSFDDEEERSKKSKMTTYRKKSRNNHQKQKCADIKFDQMINNKRNNDAADVKDDEKAIRFNEEYILSREFNLTRLNVPKSTTQVGLVADRHTMPVNKFIFNEIDSSLMFDFDKQYQIGVDFIKEKNPTTIVLYCTGLQSALVSVIKACTDYNVNLLCKHYDSFYKSYATQVAVKVDESIDDNFPFINIMKKGNVYMYKCTYEDILATSELSEDFVCLSVNEHYNEDNSFKNSMYILLKDETEMWNLYSNIYNIVSNIQSKKTSVMMAHMYIVDGLAKWGDNICKSFNFK